MKSLWIWIVNIGLKILVFRKRDANIWLFGAWNGDAYSDNSKYLFEYVTKNLPMVEAVWITKSPLIKNIMQNKKLKCYLYNEEIAQKLRLNAKYTFFTNGINDIGTYDLSQGSIKIALWHGMPLKKLLYASNGLQKKKKNLIRLLQYIYLKIYNSSQRNISIATSTITKELIIRSFEVKDDTVLITGQPRNDILFNSSVISKVKDELEHGTDEKFFLYMPTWRQFGKNDIFLDSIIEQLSNDAIFLSQLKTKNIKLYIKPHPRITIQAKSKENIVILDKSFNINAQELMASADMLITDYSSAFIDYALLDRPIYFYVPDMEDYKKNGNDLFLSFNEFSEFVVKDMNTLKDIILKQEIYYEKGLKNCQKTNAVFDDIQLIRGQYCETVIGALLNKNIIRI